MATELPPTACVMFELRETKAGTTIHARYPSGLGVHIALFERVTPEPEQARLLRELVDRANWYATNSIPTVDPGHQDGDC